VGLSTDTCDAITSHIDNKWGSFVVEISRDRPPQDKIDGLLTVFAAGSSPGPDTPEEVIEITAFDESSVAGDLLFQIDAKLGRLTRSDLGTNNTRPLFEESTRTSRREFLLSVRTGFRIRSDLPVISEEVCEAKYGCTRCVDTCPSEALRLNGTAITLSGNDCTRCGLCAAKCPIGAVQMPDFSDGALLGMLEEIDESDAPRKTLVLTCDHTAVRPMPWLVVEKVGGIGYIGLRQLAMLAASSLGGVAVVCPDGKCVGADSTRDAVNALAASMEENSHSPFVVFLSHGDPNTRLNSLHLSSKSRTAHPTWSMDRWKDYITAITFVSTRSSSKGLGLTELVVSDTCTLCGACAECCPHDSLQIKGRQLVFNASVCTGCGFCVTTCPEHSLTLLEASKPIDEALEQVRLHEDELVLCVRCGEPIGSVRLMKKLSSFEGTRSGFLRYCPSCRRLAISETLSGGAGND
jgi:ferredoxin